MPPRRKILSGGFITGPAATPGSAFVSSSIAANGWLAASTRLGVSGSGILTSYGYCAEVGSIKTRTATTSLSGTGGAATVASPSCPKTTSLRGGGFATSTPVNGLLGAALVYESRPVGGSWVTSAVPGGPSASSTVTASSYCR